MILKAFFTIERDGVEREVEIEGNVQPAEHDVGIMSSYTEDVCALDGTELTETEEDAAREKLSSKYEDSCTEDWE